MCKTLPSLSPGLKLARLLLLTPLLLLLCSTAEAYGCTPEVTPLAFEEWRRETFPPDNCYSTIRSAGYYADRFTFSGTAGQDVVVYLDSADVGPWWSTGFYGCVYLLDPSGQIIARDGRGDSRAFSERADAARVRVTLPATGTYVVETSAIMSTKTGSTS